ncbi:MAG TPA: UDP-N-acetylmuramate dehydrogenase [Bacteroidetes bacterium]|nr:UDP-N-acetylmuramate dehydrogenase [Bacteroidota bacterium]
MIVRYKYPLLKYNSFGIDVCSDKYIRTTTIKETADLLSRGDIDPGKLLILGGGSNILFTGDFHGTVLQPAFNHINIEKNEQEYVILSAEAGLNWDSLVEWTVKKNLGGLENLSYIPGNVGAAPIQNIGAYGVEAGELITKVHVLSLENGKPAFFTARKCMFGYRDSVFKNELKGKYLITKVELRLRKTPAEFKLAYGNLEKVVLEKGKITVRTIRDAVIKIRKEKLPDPVLTGNAGSFFKNPLININKYNELISKYPEMPVWETGADTYKISAAWLIEKAGWKGKREGRAGVHENHALVLVNLGRADGLEILELSRKISNSVQTMFGVELTREVKVV